MSGENVTAADARAEELRRDLHLARRLTGTVDADASRDYYPAMERIFDALTEALDARVPLGGQEPTEAEIRAVMEVCRTFYSTPVGVGPQFARAVVRAVREVQS